MRLDRTRLHIRRGLVASALAAAVALSGCALSPVSEGAGTTSDDSTPDGAERAGEPGATGGASHGTAQISAGDQDFTFELALCMISDEDVLVHGPGSNDDTAEVAYLDIDFTTVSSVMAGELRIDLGTDQHLDSSDRILIGEIGPDYDSSLTLRSDGLTLYTELREGSSGRSVGPMEALIDCG